MNSQLLNPFSIKNGSQKQSSFTESHTSQFFSYKNGTNKVPIIKKTSKHVSSSSSYNPDEKHSKKYSVHTENKNECQDSKNKQTKSSHHDIVVESNPNNTFNLLVDGDKTEQLNEKDILNKLRHISETKLESKPIETITPLKKKTVHKKSKLQSKNKKGAVHLRRKKSSKEINRKNLYIHNILKNTGKKVPNRKQDDKL